MTTQVIVSCNGNYVAEVKLNGEPAGNVGPGQNVSKSWNLASGIGEQTFTVSEREATEEELAELAKTDEAKKSNQIKQNDPRDPMKQASAVSQARAQDPSKVHSNPSRDPR